MGSCCQKQEEKENPADPTICYCCSFMCCFKCVTMKCCVCLHPCVVHCGLEDLITRKIMFLKPPPMYQHDEYGGVGNRALDVEVIRIRLEEENLRKLKRRHRNDGAHPSVKYQHPDERINAYMLDTTRDAFIMGSLELSVELIFDTVFGGGQLSRDQAPESIRIFFSKEERNANRLPTMRKPREGRGQELFFRMNHKNMSPEQLANFQLNSDSDSEDLKDDLEENRPNQEIKRSQKSLADGNGSVKSKDVQSKKNGEKTALVSPAADEETPSEGLFCEVFSELDSRGSNWFVGKILSMAKIDGETWFLVQWENPYTTSGGFYMVHTEFIPSDSPHIRPLTNNIISLLDYKDRRISPMKVGAAHYVRSSRGKDIFCVLVEPPQGRSEITIIHSHGNGADIGVMMDQYHDLAANIEVNILAYDYTGYGLSGEYGKSTVRDCLTDIEAVWKLATATLNLAPESIVLYGQSLGSGPTCHLAAKLTKRGVRVGGVVLHSPLASSIRVILDVEETHWFDVFPNVDLVPKFSDKIPFYIFMGTQDEVIDIEHGRMIAAKATNQIMEPWWVPGGGHNNIELRWRQEYLERLKYFLTVCASYQTNETNDDHKAPVVELNDIRL